ncbi:MAG: hypothetical protein R3C68_08060 [Myxococcota bacterium]
MADIAQLPVDTDGDTIPDFRDLDSDDDHLSDTYEAGAAPSAPRDSDLDGIRDLRDTDSDNDGILDACESADGNAGPCSAVGLVDVDPGCFAADGSDLATCQAIGNCKWNAGATTCDFLGVFDSDADGIEDYRDLDSDDDGIRDRVEARETPQDRLETNTQGADHDSDGTPDFRDLDSDNDGVPDSQEDVNGDGIVNCQVDGDGNAVADTRVSPDCLDAGYDYNPGCPAQKCLLAETSRIHGDTDRDAIGDGQDGVFLVCADTNLKPINLFFSPEADYALALEQAFTSTRNLSRGAGSEAAGILFDDPAGPASPNGSYAVSGLLLQRVPSAAAIATNDPDPNRVLVAKAIEQAQRDRALMAAATDVASVTLVLNRNFSSFDGFGAVVSRFNVRTNNPVSTVRLRDRLVQALDANAEALVANADSLDTFDGGPTDQDFTLLMQTLYRYDDGATGSVLVLGSLVRTGVDRNDPTSFAYRTRCSEQTLGTCAAREGCMVSGVTCVEDPNYQLPLFFADNQTGGSSLAQFGDDLANLCNSLVQRNSLLDFLWVVDNSISMAQEIDQIRGSSALFIDLVNNSEADYRVGQITTTRNLLDVTNDNSVGDWEPAYRFDENDASCDGLNEGSCQGTGGCFWTGGFCQDPGCTQYSDAGSCDAAAGGAWNGSSCAPPDCSAVACPDCSVHAAEGACTADANCKWDFAGLFCRTQSCPNCAAEDGCLFTGTPRSECVAVTCLSLPDEVSCNTGSADGCTWVGGMCIQEPRNGFLAGSFTGAVAGRTTGLPADRDVAYDCDANPLNCQTLSCGDTSNNCCPECATQTGIINSPSCYFASRLPCTQTPEAGFEFGLMMGQWATYRAGGDTACSGATTDIACAAASGCIWDGFACIAGYCELPDKTTALGVQENECNGNDPGASVNQTQFPSVPGVSDTLEDELEPAGCEWNPLSGECTPSISTACSNHNGSEAQCLARAPRCMWDAGSFSCVPDASFSRVLCSADNEGMCVTQGGGFCEWEIDGALPNGGFCRPPQTKMLRQDAVRVAVMLADEEDCYIKDHDGDGKCQFSGSQGYGFNISDYTSPIRAARTSAFTRYYASHGFTVFALVGDKADIGQLPGAGNGGCQREDNCAVLTRRNECQGNPLCVWNPANVASEDDCNDLTNSTFCDLTFGCTWTGTNCIHDAGVTEPKCYANIAEAGNAYIDVAEGTGGGWGSVCASDLFPTVEGIVMSSLGRASPYVLEALINNERVQPIASTLKVAVETCVQPTEYPFCRGTDGGSGTVMSVVPRSRDNGFDYDSSHNALLLFGSARAANLGDIVVSYRYWVDKNDQGDPTGNCPCPETNGNGCACPVGEACGSDAVCQPLAEPACDAEPGCSWSISDGCVSNGLCEPDPTCGGCATGEVCDPALGVCVCDVTCDNSCGAGETCDNNGACIGWDETECTQAAGCAWNAQVGACFSSTCGQCVCDTTCAGGCPVGQQCQTTAPNCGTCFCDTTCGGGCDPGLSCNTDIFSPTCGSCEPPRCGDCPVGSLCDPTTGFCLCDTDCGGTCPIGRVCDSDTSSLTCGQCECDTTCGGGCPATQVCNSDTGSGSCGLCEVDPTCGGACQVDCSGGADENGCEMIAGCRWAGFVGACQPITWQECNPVTGLCELDADCNESCGPTETCDVLTGQCVCDSNCGFACAPGLTCDADPGSSTCGLCLCDTTCGAVTCADGLVCDDNSSCTGATTQSACSDLGCSWDAIANQCLSVSCGRCVVDPTLWWMP